MATEPKTKPTDASVPDFIAAVEHPVRRADAEVVCACSPRSVASRRSCGGLPSSVLDRRPTSTGDWPMIAFSPRKAQLVFYGLRGGAPDAEAKLATLGKHSSKGGCVYVNKLADVDMAVLRSLATGAVAAKRGA